MKIIIAPDKFKKALPAMDVARALAKGFSRVWPDADIRCLPIADGGEGTAAAMRRALDGRWIRGAVRSPLGKRIQAQYCWIPDASNGPLAVIEMSAASGLHLLTNSERAPLRASTFGTGQLILNAMERGAKTIIVGLGGSATNDAGIGMAAALGFRFLDRRGKELDPIPQSLAALAGITRPADLQMPKILAAVDVKNPLLGPRGATRTYGPQKGAGPNDLRVLEKALKHLADVAAKHFGCDFRNQPGAGAAGGLGYGLLTFCDAIIRPGFDVVAEALQLEDAIAGCDLVVTAEGGMDSQTLEGKAPAGVAALARRHGKPVIAFAGTVHDEARLERIFDAVIPLPSRPMTLEEAMEQTAPLLTRAAVRAARLLQVGGRKARAFRSGR